MRMQATNPTVHTVAAHEFGAFLDVCHTLLTLVLRRTPAKDPVSTPLLAKAVADLVQRVVQQALDIADVGSLSRRLAEEHPAVAIDKSTKS